jgi:hypothetical protein
MQQVNASEYLCICIILNQFNVSKHTVQHGGGGGGGGGGGDQR